MFYGPSGGVGGGMRIDAAKESEPNVFISEIHVRNGARIDAIGIRLSTRIAGGTRLDDPGFLGWRGGDGGSVAEPINLTPTLRVTAIEGFYAVAGNRRSTASIWALRIHTNAHGGTVHNFGAAMPPNIDYTEVRNGFHDGHSGDGKIYFRYQIPAGEELCGLITGSGRELDAIGIVTRPRP